MLRQCYSEKLTTLQSKSQKSHDLYAFTMEIYAFRIFKRIGKLISLKQRAIYLNENILSS